LLDPAVQGKTTGRTRNFSSGLLVDRQQGDRQTPHPGDFTNASSKNIAANQALFHSWMKCTRAATCIFVNASKICPIGTGGFRLQ
jgi:hypothetical protein